jgi:hypothetical protein
MARKHRFRFGFHDVFAGRLLYCRVGVGSRQFICCGRPKSALGSELFVSSCRLSWSRADMKKPAIGFPRRGPVILSMMNLCR